jgi:hypothetical protein
VTVSSRLLVGMNRTTSRLRAALAAGVTVSALGLAVPAVAAPPVHAARVHTHVTQARLGSPPRVLLMEGRTINEPDGTSTRVPVAKLSGIYWSLVGRARHGFVLAHYDTHLHLDLYSLRHGSRQLLARTGAAPEDTQVLVGGTAGRIATWSLDDTAEHSLGAVYGAGGALLDQVKVHGGSRMLAFDGTRAVIAAHGRTQLWTPGSGKPVRLLSHQPVLASFAHDVLFLRIGSHLIGRTSLSAPGAPHWQAPFGPVGLSGDGRLVVGNVLGHTDRIQVRRVRDGHIVADLAVPGHANSQPLLLEDDHHVLVQATVRHRGVSLFRCGFQGHCVRTWPWRSASLFAGWHFSGPGLGTGFET